MSRGRSVAVAAVVLAVACRDTAPPRPTTLVLNGAPPAVADAGSALGGFAVTVQDERGRPMEGQPLAVAVGGGGSITGAPSVTLAGPTPLGTWALARVVGTNTLTITSGALPPLTITVQGAAGPPAKLASATPTSATSVVGRIFPFDLRLYDQYDNPAPGTVQFSVTGGGTLSGASGSADTGGNVAVPTWTLGRVVATNTLTASLGTASLTFTVTAEPDVAAAVRIASGDNQLAYAGTALPLPVGVLVGDRYDNPVPRQSVVLQASAGGVAGSPTTLVTDAHGTVQSSWTLSKRNVAQRLTATVPGVQPAIATATVRTDMPIELRFFGPITEPQMAYFRGAVERLTAMVVLGAGPASAVNFPVAEECGVAGAAPISEVIPGIVIYATIQPIDGPGKILAESGPCAFRSAAGRSLPAVAVLIFDVDDLSGLAAGGSVENVATHEMMHSLGYGTLWSHDALVLGSSGSDPRYTGLNAITACRSLGGNLTCAGGVPVENTGGPGTQNAHWRESIFGDEMMTGFLSGGSSPMSTISISSMADLGYLANEAAADPFVVTAGLRATAPTPRVSGWERLLVLPQDPTALKTVGGLVAVAPDRVQERYRLVPWRVR